MNNMRKDYSCWQTAQRISQVSIATMCVISTLLFVRPVHGQTECIGLDVVFLIDQSNSMGFNDQLSIRSDAVRTAIDILGDNATYYCPEVQHRISVVGFGGTGVDGSATKPYIDSFVASPSVDELSSWKIEREEAKDLIPREDSLGATDHLEALKTAAGILQRWRTEPLNGESRKSGVIMITDGGPCPSAQNNVCTYGQYGNQSGYLAAMRDFADPLGPNLSWRGADNQESSFMWIIAFNDAQGEYDYLEGNPTLVETWSRLAQGHGGDLLRMPRPSGAQSPDTANAALTSLVASILNPLLGSNLRVWACQEPIWIDPYLSNVTIIHIFRRGANPGVSLDDVNVRILAQREGRPIAEFSRGIVVSGQAEVNDYTQDGPNERYVLYLPPPGKYLIDVEGADECEDLDVRFGTSSIIAEVESPANSAVLPQVDAPPYYDEATQESFRFRLWEQGPDGKRVPLDEDPDYPLEFTLDVNGATSSGVATSESYSVTRTAPGLYAATFPITTQHDGKFVWELVAKTNNPRAEADPPDNSPIEVLRLKNAFTVIPVERFGFRFIEPKANAEVPLNTLNGTDAIAQSIPVEVELVDASGNRIEDPTTVLSGDLGKAFSIQLRGPGGYPEEDSDLRYDPSRPGVFVTELRSQGVNQLDPEGDYLLTLSLIGEYNRLRFAPNLRGAETTLRRTEAKPLDVVLITPDRASIHRSYLGCVKGDLEPFRVELQIIDVRTQKPIPINEVLHDSVDPDQIFSATLYDSEQHSETIAFQLDESGGMPKLVGQGGTTLATSGSHMLTMDLPMDVLIPRYGWAKTQVETQMMRQDTLTSNPVVCRTTSGGIGILLAGILAFVIYRMTGAPKGSIGLIRSGESSGSEAAYVAGPYRLARLGRIQTIRNKRLAELGVKKLRVTRTAPIDPDMKRAISVTATNTESVEFSQYTLQPGESVPFVDDGDLIYL